MSSPLLIRKPHVGDKGYKLNVQFKVDYDLTDVDTVVLHIQKPKVGGGYEEITKDATIDDPASSGKCHWVTVTGLELDKRGDYIVHALITYNSGDWIWADAFPWRIYGLYEY